jgi:glycosyltransferase involved in cell wall biosynthesis
VTDSVSRGGRVLFLAADLPWPPDGGGRIVSLRILEVFARHFEVDLVAMADPARPIDPGELATLCRQVEIVPHPFTFGLHPGIQGLVAARSLLSRDPYRFLKFRSPAFAAAVRRRLETGRYDLVHHEQLGVARYRVAGLPGTVATQNVEAAIYESASRIGSPVSRAWATIEAAKLRRREAPMLARFDEVFVLTAEDARSLAGSGVERVTVLPVPAPPSRPPRRPPAEPTLLTLGSMSWFGVADGLRWFHDQVWPSIRARVPAVRWTLAGSGAPADIRGWASEPGIAVVGHLPSVDDILLQTRVAVIPLRIAGGIRIKLLELMAVGLPSVSTERGVRGIDVPDGAGCYRRDDPASFAEAVVVLLTDDDRWLRTADAGRAFLVAHNRPESFEALILDGIHRAVEHHRALVSR